jgi:hypothetical protein
MAYITSHHHSIARIFVSSSINGNFLEGERWKEGAEVFWAVVAVRCWYGLDISVGGISYCVDFYMYTQKRIKVVHLHSIVLLGRKEMGLTVPVGPIEIQATALRDTPVSLSVHNSSSL